MGNPSHRAFLLIAVIISAPLSLAVENLETSEFSSTPDHSLASPRNIAITELPDWRVNDNWMYEGYLDVGDFVSDSGVSTNVETLQGTLDRTVEEIFLTNISGNETMVYRVVSAGNYDSGGIISIDGTDGCLFVDMVTTEIIRVSDLSTFSQEAEVNVYFWPSVFGTCVDWSWLNQTIGILSVENSYYPPLENYDFPISVGETWQMDYAQETEYSGSSNYVDIPDDTNDSNSTSWSVISQGSSGVPFPSCYHSYNVTSYDSEGDEIGYNWYCPEVRGEVKSSLTQAFGFLAVHELVSYQPVTRNKILTVEVEYPLSPTGIQISAWINATDQGQPIAGDSIQFRYESEQFFQNLTTDQNGTCHLIFDSGNNPDDSVGVGELGSHGLIVWSQSTSFLGASTLVIDSEVHEIDLSARSSGVTVLRNRTSSAESTILDPNSGFTAVSGDVLTFSFPVQNRGLIQSPASTISVNVPGGGEVSGAIPPLSSLQESRIELNWTIPMSQSTGNVYIYFEVDPFDEIEQDGNRSNNQGSLVLFIGALPEVEISLPSEAMTRDEVIFDGANSNDPDGGEIFCQFLVEGTDGELIYIPADNCSSIWSWSDDGEYSVTLFVSDEEGDSSSLTTTILIHNRPPIISIGSDESEALVDDQITFRVLELFDNDTSNPEASVTLLWGGDCFEGRIGQTCTVSPSSEGVFSIEIIATDDDGETTVANHSVIVKNIAPSNPTIEIYNGEERLFRNDRNFFTANEGDELTFWGQAEDSENDLESLTYFWKPDAEDYPGLNFSSTGTISIISGIRYNTSGMHLATLQVFDNDGASTNLELIPIFVENLPPIISPITTSIGELEEDEEFTIDPLVTDTENDIEDLVFCYDLDPLTDSDLDGDERNDCDQNSRVLTHSWPDSHSSPDSIIFFTSDDDGETESLEFTFDVVNTPPQALASVTTPNLTAGAATILSANGTIDSDLDMDSLIFNWDIDIMDDSDGDGDPSNDVDFSGRWIEFTYASGGLKKVKLTVVDDSSSHSVTMDLQVADPPASFSESLMSNLIPISIASLIFILSVYRFSIRNHSKSTESTNDEEPIDMDAAFDDPGPQEGNQNSESYHSETPLSKPDDQILANLEGVLEELNDKKTTSIDAQDIPSAPDLEEVKAPLDLEDIEALFEE